EYADRNRAVANQRLSGSNARWKWTTEYNRRSIAETAIANQRLSGSNARWKWTTEYNRRSIAETAMYRIKQLLG
ncbi:hypothetical protein P2M49_28975, partial [Klebsiella quasivariicola]|nr:hypothetical protein [Klebsiella quasivariicola]